MTNEEINTLILKVKNGDNDAWSRLYKEFSQYIHSRAWKRIERLNLKNASAQRKKDMEEELFQAGWNGFVAAIGNYDPKKGKFLTYATHFIDGEMSSQTKLFFSSYELTEFTRTGAQTELSVPDEPDRGRYSAERRALQIVEILRLLTDEEHSMSKEKLAHFLRMYRINKYKNGTAPEAPNTITSTVEEILAELGPSEYSRKNKDEYRIKYEGYEENRLKAKQNREKGGKAAPITNFSYVHIFSSEELDRLIQVICLSDMFSNEEKLRLANKLISTASVYYNTPFVDGDKLKFSPKAVHGRLSGKDIKDKRELAQNINFIQKAINSMRQIKFRFNCYTAEHTMIPKSDSFHILSPYHIVVYHDNYYCIGLKDDNKRIWHYRIDLMSDVVYLTDDGGPVPADVCSFDGLPIGNARWDPEKYMAEHLYMGFDEPTDIYIKIKNDDYTILHDWFGDYYEKMPQICEEGYDIVKVRTSPFMIVHWAAQYADSVEIMNEDIREKMRKVILELRKKYE